MGVKTLQFLRRIQIFKVKLLNFQICRRFMKFSLPITVILPCCFTFFMVPAVGHCTQLTAPYPMGAVMFTLDLKVVCLKSDRVAAKRVKLKSVKFVFNRFSMRNSNSPIKTRNFKPHITYIPSHLKFSM